MSIYAVIPLVSVIAYLVLIGLISSRPLAKAHKVFLWFLVVSALWSFSSFILHAEFFPNHTLPWNRALVILAISVPIIFYHFVRVYFNKSIGRATYIGYIGLIAITIFVSQGGIIRSSYVVDGILYWEYDSSLYLLTIFGGVFMATAVIYVVQAIRRSNL